jgi:preprotein translocase SecE subunit
MRVTTVANRTIDQNKRSLAKARSSALPQDEPDQEDGDLPEEESQASDSVDDQEPEDTALIPESEDDLTVAPEDGGDVDLRMSGGALATRPSARPAVREAGTIGGLFAVQPFKFFYESYYELRHKVTWPDSREAWYMSLVVIAMSLLVAAILGAADFGLNHLVSWLATY